MNPVHPDLSEAEVEALTALRRELGPTDAERARTFEGAMVGLAAGGPVDAGALVKGPQLPSGPWKRFNALQLAGTAVLSFGLGVGAHAGLSSSKGARTQSPSETVLPVETSVPRAPLPLNPPPELEAIPAPGPTPISPPRPSSIKARKGEAFSGTVYREMDRVRQAQTALSQGQPLVALGILSDLDREQPKGALGAERSMITILSLCQLGRTGEAEQRVRSSFSRGIQGDYRARLEASCARDALRGGTQ